VQLARDEAHVWSFALISSDRRSRRAESRLALRRVLAAYLDEDPERIELCAGAAGKPALTSPCHPLRFNLSHSGGQALVAVALGREVGVDVEDMSRTRDFSRLSRRWLAPRVATEIEAAPRRLRQAAFYAAWVRHEAVAKCLGSGLGAPQPAQPVSVHGLEVTDGHAAALAVAAPVALPVLRFLGDFGGQLNHERGVLSL
jgi:4'-phosphopantetheinyl transferase